MLSRAQLFSTLWTVACQAPLSMGFPRQEYWSRFPFPSPGDLPNDLGMEPASLALAGGFFTAERSLETWARDWARLGLCSATFQLCETF